MKLIEEWKTAYRLWSVRIFALLAVLPLAWDAMPMDLKAQMPTTILPILSGVAFVGLLVRLVQQTPKGPTQ